MLRRDFILASLVMIGSQRIGESETDRYRRIVLARVPDAELCDFGPGPLGMRYAVLAPNNFDGGWPEYLSLFEPSELAAWREAAVSLGVSDA